MEVDIKKLADSTKVRICSLLFALFLIAFSIRYANHHQLLFDPDSYWWYRLAMYFSGVKTEYFVKKGGTVIDTLRYYPVGHDLRKELLLLPMFIGYSFKLLGYFGVAQTPENVLKYMFVVGPFFAGLSAMLVFLLAKELSGSYRVAGLTAIFYAVAPYAMTRNTAGDTGQESIGDFMIFSWILLFFLALRYKPFSKKQIGFSLASGVVFALANYSWGGNVFYFGLISTSTFLYLLYMFIFDIEKLRNSSLPATYLLMMPVGMIISPLLVPLRYPLISITSFPYLLAYTTLLLCALGIFSIRRNIPPLVSLAGAFVVIFAIIGITGKLDDAIRFSADFLYRLLVSGEKDVTGNTVAYYRTTGFNDFKETFGILLLSVPFSLGFLGWQFKNKREFKMLFIALWLILGIIAFRWMIRLSFYLAVIMPLTFAILWDFFMKIHIKKSKFNTVALILMALLFFSPVVVEGSNLAKFSKFNDRAVVPWKDAGEWLKKNTPKDTILVHWWDYGYHLQTFAERITIVDGGNVGKPLTKNKNRNIDVACAFTSPEDRFVDCLKPYLDLSKPIYVLVSYEEFGKSGAINYHVNDNLFFQQVAIKKSGNPQVDQKNIAQFLQQNRITNYYLVDAGDRYLLWFQWLFDAQGNYHPEWENKLLAKLLPTSNGLGKGLKHFKLVYQNGYVYVYKYIP